MNKSHNPIDISIVLPTYNGAKYLRESIESCLAQTFRNWELIIVNDYSTDESGAIAEEYAAKDERIRVIHNETNLKLPVSLNVGFRQARGEYLTWTSDDNLFLPHALQVMLEFLRGHSEHIMVCTPYERIDIEGKRLNRVYVPLKHHILGGSCIGACFLYHRSVLETIGEYDPDWFLVEDYEYWLRIASKYTIGIVDHVSYLYREHPQSLTSTKKAEIGKKHTEIIFKYWSVFRDTMTDEECKLSIKSMIRAAGLKEDIAAFKVFANDERFTHPRDRKFLQFLFLKYTLKQNVLVKFVLGCFTIFSNRKRRVRQEPDTK